MRKAFYNNKFKIKFVQAYTLKVSLSFKLALEHNIIGKQNRTKMGLNFN